MNKPVKRRYKKGNWPPASTYTFPALCGYFIIKGGKLAGFKGNKSVPTSTPKEFSANGKCLILFCAFATMVYKK
jgi:hypothetical protein